MGDKNGGVLSRGEIHTQPDLAFPRNSPQINGHLQLDLLDGEHKQDRDKNELSYRASKVDLKRDVEGYVNSRFIEPTNEKLPAFVGQLVYMISRGYTNIISDSTGQNFHFVEVAKKHVGVIAQNTAIPKDRFFPGFRTIILENLSASYGIERSDELGEDLLTKNVRNEFSFSLRDNTVMPSRFYALSDFSPSSPSGKVNELRKGEPRLELYLGIDALNKMQSGLQAHQYISIQRELGEKVLPRNNEVLARDGKEKFDYMLHLGELRRAGNHIAIMRVLRVGIARGYHIEESYVSLPDTQGIFRADIKKHIGALASCYNINVPSF